VFILGIPNDNTEKNANTVNEVLIEGQGGSNKGALATLDLTGIAAPKIKVAENSAGKKEVKVDALDIVLVSGENLIGEYFLRSKANPKVTFFADRVVVTVGDPKKAPGYSALTRTEAFMDLKQESKDEFEFVIRNQAGEAVVPGFKLVKPAK